MNTHKNSPALCYQESADRIHQSIILLADFALALMSLLDKFNRNSFSLFKLRIGQYVTTTTLIFTSVALRSKHSERSI